MVFFSGLPVVSRNPAFQKPSLASSSGIDVAISSSVGSIYASYRYYLHRRCLLYQFQSYVGCSQPCGEGHGGFIYKYHAELGFSHHINPWLSRHYRFSKYYKSILSWYRRPPEQVSLHLLIFKALDVRPVRILQITKFTFVPWAWNNKTKWSRQIRLSFLVLKACTSTVIDGW